MALTDAMLFASDQSAPDSVESKRSRGARWKRVAAVLVLAVALAPGLWLRSPVRWPDKVGYGEVRFVRLAVRTPPAWPDGLRLVGAWHLINHNPGFGGYSALLAAGDTLTAVSDTARTLTIGRPDLSADPAARFGVIGKRLRYRWGYDSEAVTADPRTGVRWYAYEEINLIRRMAPGDSVGQTVRPPAMRNWPSNSGPESMVRLADGRFIVLEEGAPWLSAGARPGLLFPFDPVAGAKPLEFTFRPPIGYDPSDIAALPDGRVLILLRTLDLPHLPFFKAMLVVADPAEIAAGQEWRWHKLADLDGSVARENYEGLAVVPDARGATLWVISDDNGSPLQRTLLLELHWDLAPRRAPRGGGGR